MKLKLTTSRAQQILRLAAVCALLALAMIVWGAIDHRPIALVIAMSVGQGLGTLSLLAFLLVVLHDIRRSKLFDDQPSRFSTRPPPDGEDPK